MRRSLVIGVNGQDGSYLAEHLLAQGSEVVGIGRQDASRYVPREPRYTYHQLDLTQPDALAHALAEVRPDRIYHLAALHGASGFVYEDKWQDALAVNLGSVHVCLEHIRLAAPATRLLYASSLKAFGTPPPEVICEATPRRSSCLYSITKNAATDLIDYYRSHHRVRASVLYLLNHESPRRPANYMLPSMVALLASAIEGKRPAGRLRSLDFACDWGSSAEYMALGCRLLEDNRNQDYVMATGRTLTGEELLSALFARAGLDWRACVELDKPVGSEPIAAYRADISRLVEVLGAGPRSSAIDVALWILKERHGHTI